MPTYQSPWRRAAAAALAPVALAAAMLTAAGCGGRSGGGGGTAAPDSLAAAASDSAAPAASAPADSLLRVAVLPTADALPLFYASATGLLDSLTQGRVALLRFTSAADVDTALAGGSADGALTDLVALHYGNARGGQLVAVAATDGPWALVSCGTLRIRAVDKLKGRMVAVARYSAADAALAEALAAAGLAYGDVFRPQINDLGLRATMLNGNQVDAAVLPQPQATAARLSGHRVLAAPALRDVRPGCVAFSRSALEHKAKARAVVALLKACNAAADSLNAGAAARQADALAADLGVSRAVFDSLRLPRYSHAALPRKADVDRARTYLRQRGVRIDAKRADSWQDGGYLP